MFPLLILKNVFVLSILERNKEKERKVFKKGVHLTNVTSYLILGLDKLFLAMNLKFIFHIFHLLFYASRSSPLH